MDDSIPAFSSKDEAFEWMDEVVNDPYVDNERFAFKDNPISMAWYTQQQEQGCCGAFDADILVDGREATIGCNYGH